MIYFIYFCTKVSIDMQILGYIVSKRKIKDVVSFIEVVESIDLIQDRTKPILVIGLNEAKKLANNFSILEKEISENLYWTFSKTERRVDYDRDLDWFYSEVLRRSIIKINYTYVNIITFSYNRLKNLILFLKSSIDKHIYIYNDMLYIYYDNKVLGISLRILKYNKIKVNKVISLLKENPSNNLYYTDKCLSFKLKQIIRNKKYVTPYFLSIFEC